MNRLIIVSCCALSALAISAPASVAVTHTWNPTSGGSMNSAANWTGGIPVSSSPNLTLIFPNGANVNALQQDIPSPPLVVESMQFGPNWFYIFNGGGFQFDNLGGAPTMSIDAGTGVNFVSDLDFSDPTTITLDSGSSLDLVNVSGGDLTFNGVGIGQAQVSFAGAAANTLTGTNTFSGNGIYYLQKPANTAAIGGNIIVSGPLQFPQTQLYAVNANQFAPGANLSAINFGNVNLQADQEINNFELSTGGNAFVASNRKLTIKGALSSAGGNGFLGSGGGTANVDFDGQFMTVNVGGAATDLLQVSAPIVNGRINKTGPGTLAIFSSSNSFTGQNVVSAGTLQGNPDSIGTNVLNNATVELGFGALNSNIISGPGQVRVGTITFNAAQSYTGGTDVFGSAIGNASTLAGDFTSSNSGTVVFQQATNATSTNNFTGNVGIVKQGAGVLSLGGASSTIGEVVLAEGGLNFLTDSASGTGPLSVAGSNPVTLEATGNRTLANLPQFFSGVSFVGGGNLTFSNSSTKSVSQPLTHASSGTTQIDGKFVLTPAGSITVNSGTFVLGDPNAIGGFAATGPITLNGGTLTVRNLNFTTLSDVTLAGGTLNAPAGYAIPLGAALQGNGAVTGRVASANGSTIIAAGNLSLGDSASPAGVNLDGELYTGANAVTLDDSNQAVLGSLTDVGTASSDGTLASPNGMVLNFGRNLVGRGQVQSNNALADAVIVNGDVNGDSISTPLVFTGYVKGVGTFNNVAFSGTFAPGLSPTLMTVGNTILLPTNTLEMELGGLNRGGQYDAFDVTSASTMVLDGTMQVTLINGFNPSAGNQFDLFNGTTTGTFDSLILPPLNVGLIWDASQLYTNGILQVVAIPEPATLSMALAVGLALLRRRNTRVRV